MVKLTDRLSKLDDATVIHRADDPEQKVHWHRAAAACLVVSVIGLTLFAGVAFFIGELRGCERGRPLGRASRSCGVASSYVRPDSMLLHARGT